MKGSERLHISLSQAKELRTHHFVLWPFDHAVSRGHLMAVTMRLTPDKVLVFGYRSVPFWQDVKINRYPTDSEDGPLANEDMRYNIRGLSVGYSSRYRKSGGLVGLGSKCCSFIPYTSSPQSWGGLDSDIQFNGPC